MGLRRLTSLLVFVHFALACAPPSRGAAGAPEILYVASGAAGTVTRIDASNGRPVGAPVVVGGAAWSLIPAPNGGVLVHPLNTSRPGVLPHVRPMPGRSNAWEVLQLSVRSATFSETLIAGDGGRYAVAAAPARTSATGTGVAWCRLTV